MHRRRSRGWRRPSAAGSGELRERRAEDRRVAGRRPGEAEHHAQRRRLARAVRAEEAGDRARADREGQVVDGRHVAVALGQPGSATIGRRVPAARHGYNLTRNLLTASAVVRLWLLASPCWSRPSPPRCSRAGRSGGATPIATLAAPTPVRAWAGTAVLSVQDPATGAYRLATQRGTAAPQPLPGIAPGGPPFDADIGSGPRRGGGDRLRPLPGSAPLPSVAHDARGRDRDADRRRRRHRRLRERPDGLGRPVGVRPPVPVRLRARLHPPVDAGTQVRSTRLPGVPARQCDEIEGCHAIRDGTVRELELRGATLAANVHFGLRTVGICGEGQLRLVDVARRTSRLVTRTICGLSGSTLLGASLTATRLLYARVCPGDPAGCQNHSTIVMRYGLAGRRFEQVPSATCSRGSPPCATETRSRSGRPNSHDGDLHQPHRGTTAARRAELRPCDRSPCSLQRSYTVAQAARGSAPRA